MAKTKVKTAYFCQSCGSQHPKWQGQCSACKEWNTVVEEVLQKEELKAWAKNESNHKIKAQKVAEISLKNEARIQTHNIELARVLGGGIVPGAILLLGGEPGIGKSTLMLQLALSLQNCKTLYVSGEESDKQIKMRAERLGEGASDCYILTETATQNIFTHINALEPDLVVIDSIQTLHTQAIDSSPGSISQIRETAAELLRFAKETATPVILIGHITKDGNIAGPKILEHMVDVVLQFEGDRNHIYRILRAQKNRFGSTAELGIYEMVSHGLREVHNPSEILISQKDEALSGTAIAATVEGMRPMLIEIQALVSSAVYGTPQRSATAPSCHPACWPSFTLYSCFTQCRGFVGTLDDGREAAPERLQSGREAATGNADGGRAAAVCIAEGGREAAAGHMSVRFWPPPVGTCSGSCQ